MYKCLSSKTKAPRRNKTKKSQSFLMMQSQNTERVSITTHTHTHARTHRQTDRRRPLSQARTQSGRVRSHPQTDPPDTRESPLEAVPETKPSHPLFPVSAAHLPLHCRQDGAQGGEGGEGEARLGRQRCYTLQHCFLLALELTVGATDIVCTLPLGELSSSGLSRICFWETIL